jgi:hypothetical protein
MTTLAQKDDLTKNSMHDQEDSRIECGQQEKSNNCQHNVEEKQISPVHTNKGTLELCRNGSIV